MEEDIFVELKEVSIGYRERLSSALVVKSNLSLHALGGEMIALIGGNGTGKSTLLKTIAGFQPPLSGEIYIHAKAFSAYTSEKLAREMSFVSTEIVRVANLTVSEMVGLGRFPYTGWFGQLGETDLAIVHEAIRHVGLSGYENRPVSRISDGERQRVMIARALAQDTPVMILDEPTAFLDISNKYEIVTILRKLADEQGKCIIYSTHDLNSALLSADHIWLMLGDRLVAGIPEDLALNGHLSGMFPGNPHLVFDPMKEDFRIRKENRGTIVLTATGSEKFAANKALERLGFEVIDESTVSGSSNNRFVPVYPHVTQTVGGWLLEFSGSRTEAASLENLCRAVRKIRL